MSAPTEPAQGLSRPNDWVGSLSGIAVYLLSLLWLLIPTVQYLGAIERTMPVGERTGPLGALAELDLTPWYVALLCATLFCWGLRASRSRLRSQGTNAEGA